jgi:hypothetical protein
MMSATPQPAPGTLLTSNALGFAYAAQPGVGGWGHPWRPYLGGGQLRLSRGTVEGFTPKIDGKPMTERTLLLDPALQTADGESWAILEVEPNADGILTKESRIEIVHGTDKVSNVPEVGRIALALIVWKGSRPALAIPAVHMNLRYVRVKPASGPTRHFFP